MTKGIMTWEKVKELNSQAMGRWYAQRTNGDCAGERRKKFYSRYCNCGKSFTRFGRTNFSYCRSIVCPRCSARFTHKLTKKFVKQYPDGHRHNYGMVTISLGYALSAESALLMMRTYRDKTAAAANAKKGRKSARMQPWKDFSFVGCLDFYSFRPVDFHRLGTDKQRQFIDEYKYDPNDIRGNVVYDVHLHGCFYADGLEIDDVLTMLCKYAKSVYPTPMFNTGTVDDNVNGFLGYSTKVWYTNKFNDGRIIPWNIDRIRDFCEAASCQSGNQGRKIFIGRTKSKGEDEIKK